MVELVYKQMPLTDKVYGPYTRKDGRKHVIVVKDGSRRTVSYPKYLMEQHLGRELHPWLETVDHINRDFTDDRIENLQIKTKPKHAEDDAIRAKLVEIICIRCGNKALKKANSLRGNSKKGKAGPFCSRRCSGAYGAELQNGRVSRLDPQPYVESIFYRNEKGV